VNAPHGSIPTRPARLWPGLPHRARSGFQAQPVRPGHGRSAHRHVYSPINIVLFPHLDGRAGAVVKQFLVDWAERRMICQMPALILEECALPGAP